MALVRRIARPLLAAPFIFEGVRTALHPEREIDVYPQAFDAVDSALGKTSTPGFVDVRTVVRATGAIAAGAGILYATNRYPPHRRGDPAADHLGRLGRSQEGLGAAWRGADPGGPVHPHRRRAPRRRAPGRGRP